MSEQTVDAGWYSDPTGRFTHRYWDGSTWTEHVGQNGQQSVDPLQPLPPPIPVAVSTPSRQLDGQEIETVAEPTDKKPGLFTRIQNDRKEKAQGRDAFERIALDAAHGNPQALAGLPAEVETAKALYRGAQFDSKAWEVLKVAIRDVIEDDVMTAEEESHLHVLGNMLGISFAGIAERDHALMEEVVIAGINNGRFPACPNTSLRIKPGEEARGEFIADLMKEVAIREFRGGSSSVSVPIGMGMRYRVGGVRGRSVVVGTEQVAQDSGILVVTSDRAVFMGTKKTLEFRFDRLVGLEQYTDGLRLNVSNRQTASVFKFRPGFSPSIAAALISATTYP